MENFSFDADENQANPETKNNRKADNVLDVLDNSTGRLGDEIQNNEIAESRKGEVFENFIQQEKEMVGGAGKFLAELTPEKLKKTSAALLAAFSIVIDAQSAFAGEKFETDELSGKLFPAKEFSETINQRATNSDWRKIIEKLEISAGGKIEGISQFNPEAVPFGSIGYSEANVKYADPAEANMEDPDKFYALRSNIEHSSSAAEFFNSLDRDKLNFNDHQKIIFLQSLGDELNGTYDFDMAERNEHVKISDEAMFRGMKNSGKETIKTGTCGNIHAFMVKIAEQLGLDAWLQSGLQRDLATKQNGHIYAGLVAEYGDKKQIVFLNYGDVIPTGTLNYQDALGIAERYLGGIATFNSFVSNEKETLFPVKSRAQAVEEKFAGIEQTGGKLESELSEGKVANKERGLEIELSPEVKEIKLTKDYIAITYSNFEDVYGNPYQSLKDVNAVRGQLNLKGEKVGWEAGATLLHVNLKDFHNGSIAQDEIIGRVAADYIDGRQLTKGDYGRFVLNWGATLQAALRWAGSQQSNTNEGGYGARLIYLNPDETSKFYVSASDVLRDQVSDVQSQKSVIKEAARNFTVGAEIKVNEARVARLEISNSQLDWGKGIDIKGGLSGERWKVGGEYEKDTSYYERFIPSKDKVSAEISYQDGPRRTIDVLGFKETEKYSGAKDKDIYGVEVKLKILMF